MNDIIVREIGCHKFPGFYESIFSDSDEFIDYEYELEEELRGISGKEKIEVVFEYIDFKKYMHDICEAFMDAYVDKIKDVLPYDITEHEDFKFDIIEDDDIIISSPKYYNYSTDKCYRNIATNRKTLKLIKEYTLRLDGVEKYIKEHFTSCDGFISFITNDFNEWKELDIEDYEENMLIALLDMLICLSEDDVIFNISYDVINSICKICYAQAFVFDNGKEYTEAEFRKKFGGE